MILLVETPDGVTPECVSDMLHVHGLIPAKKMMVLRNSIPEEIKTDFWEENIFTMKVLGDDKFEYKHIKKEIV